jgi:hypothetical protein
VVIRRVSANFVPVALNLYEVRKASDAAGKFFKAVQKKRPAQYQGVYIVSYDGKVLSSQGRQPDPPKSWTKDLLEVIDAGLGEFGAPVPRKARPSDPLPHRGVGARADGGVTLAVYARVMLNGLERRGLGQPTIDSLALPGKDWSALAPRRAEAGASWEVPQAVARKLNRVLCPVSDQNSMPRPEEVTSVRLTGKVEAVRAGVAYLRYEGQIAGAHTFPFEPHKGKKTRGEAKLLGVGAYDVKAGRLLSLTLLADGAYRHHPPYDHEQKYGAVVEWRAKRE